MTRRDYIKMAELYIKLRNMDGINNNPKLKGAIYNKIVKVLKTYPNFDVSKFDDYVSKRFMIS